jgi:hypothetical protein
MAEAGGGFWHLARCKKESRSLCCLCTSAQRAAARLDVNLQIGSEYTHLPWPKPDTRKNAGPDLAPHIAQADLQPLGDL